MVSGKSFFKFSSGSRKLNKRGNGKVVHTMKKISNLCGVFDSRLSLYLSFENSNVTSGTDDFFFLHKKSQIFSEKKNAMKVICFRSE